MAGPMKKAQWDVFARFVAGGGSQSDAYREAYPHSKNWSSSAVARKASAMAARPDVAARIVELATKVEEEFVVRTADLLRESMRLALMDPSKIIGIKEGKNVILLPHELDADTRAAIASFEIDEFGKVKYKFWDKNSALERLFKHKGLFEKDNAQTRPEIPTSIQLVPLQPVEKPKG